MKGGEIVVDGPDISGRLVIDMEQIYNWDLNNALYNSMLVRHLKSKDFFEVEEYPEAVIEIVSCELLNSGYSGDYNYKIFANLTIKDVTREVDFFATVREKDGGLSFNAHFDIDRSKWNVKYGSEKFFARLGMHVVSDLISFDVILKAELNSREVKNGTS